MIEIKRLGGETIISLPEIPEGSLVHRELMADHYVKLPFTLAEPAYLRLGDYVELPSFGRFELTEPYSPKYNRETAGYDYTLQLDAYYMKWKNKKVRYMPQSAASETTFNLTAAIGIHLNVIVNGINALGEKDENFKFEGSAFRWELKNFPADKVNTAKYKLYDKTDFITALNDLATIFDCEWWVENNTIYFGKCKIDGTEIDFSLEDNVEEMSSTQSKNEYATRVIAFGAARNLPSSYRKDNSADITVNGVVQKRLMLPLDKCPKGYVQDEGLSNETEAIEAIVVNEDIYPRTKCKVSSIETYIDTAEDEETGETITRTFYRLKDGSGLNFSTDFILEGETLHILFQSGAMNGMDFECQYNDEEKYYEVVANENYGRFLPDENLHPAVGDDFVLYGWDSTKIGDTHLIEDAEEELYEYILAKLQDMHVDPNTYNCSMKSDWYAKKMEEDRLSIYSLGQPVRLINPTYFASGRSSRIIGYEVKLDFIYDSPEYIVGEAAAYSRTQSMQEQIDALTYNGRGYAGGNGGSGVYIITTSSTTPASDCNVYSAARADKQFLRRDKDDTAQGKITFNNGITVNGKTQLNGDADVKGAATIGGNASVKGNAEVSGISHLRTTYFGEYVKGLIAGASQGAVIEKSGDGRFKSVSISEFLEVPELRYNRALVTIGIGLRSEGGGIIETVTPRKIAGVRQPIGEATLKLEDGEVGAIMEGDLLLGFWHNEDGGNAIETTDDKNGDYQLAGFTSVYFEVVAVDANDQRNSRFTYQLRSETDPSWTSTAHPFAGMHFASIGHRYSSHPTRQQLVVETTTYSLRLTGLNDWNYSSSNIYEIHGLLDGFSMQKIGEDGKPYTRHFTGYGQVFGNAYVFGNIEQFQRAGYRMVIDQSLNGSMAPGETETVTCVILDGYNRDVTNRFTYWSITRNSGDTASDEVWNAAHTSVTNPFEISFSDLGIDGIHRLLTVFYVTASDVAADTTLTAAATYNS